LRPKRFKQSLILKICSLAIFSKLIARIVWSMVKSGPL